MSIAFALSLRAEDLFMTCFAATPTPQPTVAAVALKQKEIIQSAKMRVVGYLLTVDSDNWQASGSRSISRKKRAKVLAKKA
jgi:hypothetical protein